MKVVSKCMVIDNVHGIIFSLDCGEGAMTPSVWVVGALSCLVIWVNMSTPDWLHSGGKGGN